MAFDYLRCKYPLPAVGANKLLYQTRSTPPPLHLGDYEIRDDGSLWRQEFDLVADPDPLLRGLGQHLSRNRRSNLRWVLVKGYSGALVFYTHHVCDPQFKFCASISAGVVSSIIQMPADR